MSLVAGHGRAFAIFDCDALPVGGISPAVQTAHRTVWDIMMLVGMAGEAALQTSLHERLLAVATWLSLWVIVDPALPRYHTVTVRLYTVRLNG
jgi:hypothetical protein